MSKGLSIWLLVGTLAVALGAPVDELISFSTTVAPQAHHGTDVMATVCVSMTPLHGGNLPQSIPPPFTILVSKTTAVPGDTVQVKVIGTSLSDKFVGAYIQGRNEDIPVGHFLAASPDSPPVSLNNCLPGEKNAASYISRQPINEITFDYVVPDVSSVVFKATLMKSFSIFWTFVASDRILVSTSEV